MDTWLNLARAAGDILTFATALVTFATTITEHRRSAKKPHKQRHVTGKAARRP
jgi:hypothetical protein